MHPIIANRSRRYRAIVALLALGCSPVLPAQDENPQSHDCIIEPSRVLEVGTAAVGVLQEVRVERADRVQAEQVVAVLESGVEEASVDLARLRASIDTEVLARQVTFELQRSNQKRTARLHATHVVAEQTREEAEHDARLSALRLRQAKEEKRLAELELVRARHALARRTIRSPVDGVVMERLRSPGERVEDQPVLRIAQLHPLRVEVVLPVELFGVVRTGMRAKVRPQYAPGGEFEAQVVAIDPVLDAASSTFGVRLALPNADYAIPGGLRCTLAFLPASARQAEVDAPSTGTAEVAPVDEVKQEPAAAPAQRADVVEKVRVPPAAENAPPTPTALPVEPPARKPPPPVSVPDAIQAEVGLPEIGVCQTLGPLKNEAQAKRLQRAFSRESIDARLFQRPDETPVGYLVAVELDPAAGGTDKITAVLREQGLRDYQVLTGAPGRVSVGYFRGPQSARVRARLVRELGLPTRIEPRSSKKKRYFLEIDVPASARQGALVKRILGSQRVTDLQPEACAELVTAQR